MMLSATELCFISVSHLGRERIRNIWHQIVCSAANNADLNFNIIQRTRAEREWGSEQEREGRGSRGW